MFRQVGRSCVLGSLHSPGPTLMSVPDSEEAKERALLPLR